MDVCPFQPYPTLVKVSSNFTKAGAERLYVLALVTLKATATLLSLGGFSVTIFDYT